MNIYVLLDYQMNSNTDNVGVINDSLRTAFILQYFYQNHNSYIAKAWDCRTLLCNGDSCSDGLSREHEL